MSGFPTYEQFCREQRQIRESTRERRALVLTGPSELLGSSWHPANRIEEDQ